jgi:hypothetical protein
MPKVYRFSWELRRTNYGFLFVEAKSSGLDRDGSGRLESVSAA